MNPYKKTIIYPESMIDTRKFLRDGESIEEKMRRVTTTNEPIDDIAPPIYQERNAGVDPACDPRTDRFDLAIEAMDKVYENEIAKRSEKVERQKQNEEVTYVTE